MTSLPGRDDFLAAILGERDPAGAAAFAAAIVGEESHRDGRSGRTAGPSRQEWLSAILYGAPAADMLREYNFNPDEPRDEKGRWTTGDPAEQRIDDLRQQALKALAPKDGTPPSGSARDADANSALFGKHTFTSKGGSRRFDARFAGFDANGHVLLKKDDGTTVAADPKYFSDSDAKFLTDLAKLREDKGFAAGLKAKPDNIHLDSTGKVGQLDWEAQVIRDIGKLSELPRGRALLDDVRKQGQEITINPQSRRDNKARGGMVYYDPGDTAGARAVSGNERPPFIGLGQELFNAKACLAHAPTREELPQYEKNGLGFGQDLRVDYNETIRDRQKLDELRDRYPESRTGYPGWGTKEVDERVLGLDGNVLRRRGDR